MRWIVATLLVSIVGCAMPGQVKRYTSQTDNIEHVEINPGWLIDHSVRLGLHRTSSMPEGAVNIIVLTKGSAPDTKDGLTINVDGKKTVLSSIDAMSDFDEYNFARKRYVANLDLVRAMVNGKSVWVKISLIGQSYTEGSFTVENSYSAKTAFTNFLNSLDGKSETKTK